MLAADSVVLSVVIAVAGPAADPPVTQAATAMVGRIFSIFALLVMLPQHQQRRWMSIEFTNEISFEELSDPEAALRQSRVC